MTDHHDHGLPVEAAVDITSLGHHYADALALDHINLRLPLGKTIGLVGPDGVGKSTLLSIVAGVKRIQHGQVKVLGLDMADADCRATLSPRVAFMPQ
jgi:ribosome-dependent ATPase